MLKSGCKDKYTELMLIYLQESQILLQICPDQLCPLDLSRKHHALKAEALQQAVEFLIALLKVSFTKRLCNGHPELEGHSMLELC